MTAFPVLLSLGRKITLALLTAITLGATSSQAGFNYIKIFLAQGASGIVHCFLLFALDYNIALLNQALLFGRTP